ncbi:unnamed protein product [Acanthoscelides obtectus]|uniref:Uncharacterized protein n=1 Tax=Acanthoscelides obtectus TaxID=200917 RepID=A0A9P0PAS2_ACAOB|nr:unnamed protein product [Acanthoscelides obtectus]CAK1650126.1 hypothetical protein AOBTE_LOCUS16614 [Acanthoscelides obtectus]
MGTSFHYRRAILFCSASARRPEIFLLFCLGHLRWIVEENFIDNFLGHFCCECVASFFCLPLDPRNSTICRIVLSSAALFARRNHVKNPTQHHLGFFILGESSLLEIH